MKEYCDSTNDPLGRGSAPPMQPLGPLEGGSKGSNILNFDKGFW